MIFFEYSQFVVDAELIPSQLCYSYGSLKEPSAWDRQARADRIYQIEGNTVTELKNRNGIPSTYFISDEDKLVLILKGVLLYK